MDDENQRLRVLGFEVDKSTQISIKTFKLAKYIESDIQNIEVPINYDSII